MSDFEDLRQLFQSTPVLVTDAGAERVALVTYQDARQRAQKDVTTLFPSAVFMDLQRALSNFARLVKTADREFTMNDIAAITALPYSKCHQWVNDGILNPSVRSGDGPGRGKDRLFSWRDAFVAGVCAGLRRQGVGLQMLRKVAKLLDRGATFKADQSEKAKA